MDLQPVFNYYVAVPYMSASSSKSDLITSIHWNKINDAKC